MCICKITVYEYRPATPRKMEVTAACVGGDEGVFAVFRMPENHEWIGIAKSDDGHWQLIGVYNEYWIKEIIAVFSEVGDKI